MSIYLIKREWGYQTCCHDEENIVGYFKPENPDTIQIYPKPSFDSIELEKTKTKYHEEWKSFNSKSCNMTKQQMDKTFGNIYNIDGSDILIGKSNSIWGWEKIKDKENRITWIRVDRNEQLWAPYDYYDDDEEDNDTDYEDLNDFDTINNNNNSDEDPSDEIKKLCL